MKRMHLIIFYQIFIFINFNFFVALLNFNTSFYFDTKMLVLDLYLEENDN